MSHDRICCQHRIILLVYSTTQLLTFIPEVQEKAHSASDTAGVQWSCIIFAEQKVVCFAISRLLQACQDQLSFLRVTKIMGASGKIPGFAQPIPVSPKQKLTSTILQCLVGSLMVFIPQIRSSWQVPSTSMECISGIHRLLWLSSLLLGQLKLLFLLSTLVGSWNSASM